MRIIRRVLVFVVLIALTTIPVMAQSSDQPWQTITEIPASEQLPAAPLLVAAYAIVWLVPMFYLWFIWRRLNHVEREMRDLERRTSPGGTGA